MNSSYYLYWSKRFLNTLAQTLEVAVSEVIAFVWIFMHKYFCSHEHIPKSHENWANAKHTVYSWYDVIIVPATSVVTITYNL